MDKSRYCFFFHDKMRRHPRLPRVMPRLKAVPVAPAMFVALLLCTLSSPSGASSAQRAAQGSPHGISSEDLLAGLAAPTRWLMYSGDYAGHRHSPLAQITPANAGRLTAQWTFQTNLPGKFESTPLAIDGVLYVTGLDNTAWAIDGRTGEELARYQRDLPDDLRLCCGPVNRGFAVHGDYFFMTTLDAHLLALDPRNSRIVWDVEMAEYSQGYSATVAPLVVKDMVIAGISGGEYAVRGFLDAYDVHTGRRLWRFYTIPAPGEPGSETWPGDAWERGGGPTWVTGTYDPETNTLFWGTGNPSPDYYGDTRVGDNLYTNSLLALDADTGALRWYFQFTPHDVRDWDANHVPVLAELPIDGAPRKVVLVANRNGFFYVLDRTTGRLLRATPFVDQNWAKGIDPSGRPIEIPGQRPSPTGTVTCPDSYGGTNFMSPSYDPQLRLFFVTARETCHVFYSEPPRPDYKPGDRVMGGRVTPAAGPHHGALRALDAVTGERVWDLTHPSPSWAGVLSTAGGVVFTGTHEGDIVAAESRTGRELWRYRLGAPIYAAPITYMIDGRQYVLMPAGTTLTAFALPAWESP